MMNYYSVYLDHNILDSMRKGDPDNIKELLKSNNFVPIYSNETLTEIHRSEGYQNKFLELLDEIQAIHIELNFDENFKQTGTAKLNKDTPMSLYKRFLENLAEFPEGLLGLSDFFMKIHGGQSGKSFEDIHQESFLNLEDYLNQSLDRIDELLQDALDESEISIEDLNVIRKIIRQQFEQNISELPEVKNNSLKMAQELDERKIPPISEFQSMAGVGAIVLNNVNPPNVVNKIWNKMQNVEGIDKLDREIFFGLKPYSFEEEDKHRTIPNMVYAIYNQLNNVGYYPDSKISQEKRFRASFSDANHVSIAVFCHYFLSKDENLVMKAQAAYEYLRVGTKIIMPVKWQARL